MVTPITNALEILNKRFGHDPLYQQLLAQVRAEAQKEAQKECEHKFVFLRQEKVGSRSGYQLEDVFFCERCLQYQRRKARGESC